MMTVEEKLSKDLSILNLMMEFMILNLIFSLKIKLNSKLNSLEIPMSNNQSLVISKLQENLIKRNSIKLLLNLLFTMIGVKNQAV